MARKHYANALVARNNVPFDEWMEVMRAQNEGAVPRDHVHRIAKTVLRKCDPNQYLLSHATIVASVDTYAPKGVKLGTQLNKGVQIDVRYPDFRIDPKCSQIINNNGDAWSRGLLLSTYRTFIGAQNYLEHVQIPELSKGFIVDAIARDLGSTCYIDILVATDRKHGILVNDILSGTMQALSMGCFEADTRVTMGDGSVLPIVDVRPGMEVISQKGNVCKVANLQIRENRWSMRRVKVEGLPVIKATDNHDFYVQMVDESGKATFKKRPAGELRVGDIVATPIPVGNVDPTVTESEARFLGLYIGDGWKFDLKHDNTVGIGLCLDKKYAEIVEDAVQIMNQVIWKNQEMKIACNGRSSRADFVNALTKSGSFSQRCRDLGISRQTGHSWLNSHKADPVAFLEGDKTVTHQAVSRSTRRNADYLTCTSKSLRSLVDSHTTGRNAQDKLLNQDVMFWPKEHQLQLLAGIIDSDGCVSVSNRGSYSVHISTRNENLANQYLALLARCGIVGTLSKAKRGATKMVRNGQGIDYQIRIRNDGVERIPSFKIRAHTGKFRAIASPGRWIEGNHLFARVKSVGSYDYEGFVYDMEVEKDHSYIANGVGVSNCISSFTVCTKCGNVASDDSQLCPCIQYEGKHTLFTDEDGQQHKIAELIGHVSVPNSNQFIEASWVKNPAFRGAVRRNFLNDDPNKVAALMETAQAEAAKKTVVQVDGMKKAASMIRFAEDEPDLGALLGGLGGDDSGGDEEPPAESPAPDSSGSDEEAPETDAADGDAGSKPKGDKIDSLLDKVQEQLLSIMVDRLGDKLKPTAEDVSTVKVVPKDLSKSNDGLIRGASKSFAARVAAVFPGNPQMVTWATKAHKIVNEGGPKEIARVGMKANDLIALSWIEDLTKGRKFPVELYKLSMKLGPVSSYATEKAFLAAASLKAGRSLTASEQSFLKWKGHIASFGVR